MHVRRADATDIDWIVGELKQFSAFFNSKKPLFGDEAFARESMAHLIKTHVVFVAERSDQGRMGFIAGVLAPHPFNPKIKVLSESFWWVAEAHRGSRAAVMLLTTFISFGKANADWITMGLEAHSPINDDALIKRGFALRERCFLMEIE